MTEENRHGLYVGEKGFLEYIWMAPMMSGLREVRSKVMCALDFVKGRNQQAYHHLIDARDLLDDIIKNGPNLRRKE